MAEVTTTHLAAKDSLNEQLGEVHRDAEAQAKAQVLSWKKPGPAAEPHKGPPPVSARNAPLLRSNAKLGSTKHKPLGQVDIKLSGQSAKNERPPDAFALLKEARAPGTLFVEDSQADGYSEEREDPELAEAVEECIRRCFGLSGVLRIGPGRNDREEPIIVVATTHGFTEASLAQVPARVHRFATLTTIPFELLPLKRER